MLLEWCQWLENTHLAMEFRSSAYVYPIVEGMHVLALSLSVGTVMFFDLRLMGLARRGESVSEVFDQLRPVMLVGFAVMFLTGALLFAGRAVDAYNSTYFRIKMGLLVLAAVNIAVFHLTVDRRRHEFETSASLPRQVRLAGLLSLLLWFAVIAAGRIMAYTL